MDPFAFGSDTSDDTDQYEVPDREDDNTLCDGIQLLGIEKSYVPDWKPPHAIREYHQNWRDGIKETTGLRSRDFIIEDKGFDSRDVYTFEARHPDTRDLLGFIRWKDGTIQYSNFGARLKREYLNFGVSTKRDDGHFAGLHGEGFKVASLIMIRRGYHVRYEASKFYWSFQFNGRHGDTLACKLTRMEGKKLQRLMDEYKAKCGGGSPRELKANIWEDVTVSIGRIQGRGDKVEKADFLKWITVSLDIDRPSRIIRTAYGSLVLDKRFKGRIYLKGLLLEGESAAPYKFCYDFYEGEVNRDRQRLSNPREEAQTLARIWGEAVTTDEASALPKLIELLQADTSWADVNLVQEYISIETARKIWHHFRDANAEGNLFYYYEQRGNQDIELIAKSLQKKPVPLKQPTWLSLRRFGLIRTPQEQRHHLLRTAPASKLPSSLYSRDVCRVLMSVLALDSRTRNLELDFRCGGVAELDLLLDNNCLLINDKWLGFVTSHQSSSCSLFLQATAEQSSIDRFSCGHLIKSLYDSVLVELSADSGLQQQHYSDDYMRQLVSEKIDQMPCMVSLVQVDAVGELEVSWIHAESEKIFRLHRLQLEGHITLHRKSTCAHMDSDLLSDPSELGSSPHQIDRPGQDYQGLADCGCPEMTVRLREGKAKFMWLDCDEEYFPMVARSGSQAVFALPPAAVRPKDPETAALTYHAPVHSCDYTCDVCDGELERFSDGSDDETIDMDIAGPVSEYERQRDISRPGRTLWPRPEHDTNPCRVLIARMNGEVQQLQAEIEVQRETAYTKDAHLHSLQAELKTLRSQLRRQGEKNKQCMDKAESHRASLVLKDDELRDAISELARRDEGLDLTIEALRTNQLRLNESASKFDEYLDLLETIQYRSLEAEFTNAQSEGEPVNSPTLWETLDPLIRQSEQLVGHLKQADRDAQDALDMAVRVATAMHTVSKRKRITEGETESENDCGSSQSADTMKRPRLSNN